MTITVHNCKRQHPNPRNPKHIYCGRKMSALPASPLGNPFVLGKDGNRDQAIQLFRQDLWRALNHQLCDRLNGQAAYDELFRIARIVKDGNPVSLFCWCTPQPCHCDIIKAAILWLLETDNL